MAFTGPSPADRARGMIAGLALPGLLLWVLIAGLAVRMPGALDGGMAIFDITPERPPPPPPPPVPAPKRNQRPEGAAAPPNLRSQATEIVAPKLDIPLPPPPVVTAPTPNVGTAPSQGAAPIPGPGTGAGGQGTGTGSGAGGDGDGGGYDEDDTPPRQIRGAIRVSDLPDDLAEGGVRGVVSVRYFIDVDGRASRCRATRSSGIARLDALTCRLIEERFRFDPSRDGRGRPVGSWMVQDHEWEVDEEYEQRRRR